MGLPPIRKTVANGFGMIKSDQLPLILQYLEHAYAVGITALPVREAMKAIPVLMHRFGPRGPSGVMTIC